MNQFEALGLAYRVNAGYRLIVMVGQPERIPAAVDIVAEQARFLSDKVRVVRTKMEERVEVGTQGGEVIFTWRKSQRLEGRDYKADVLLMDGIGHMSAAEEEKLHRVAVQVIRR